MHLDPGRPTKYTILLFSVMSASSDRPWFFYGDDMIALARPAFVEDEKDLHFLVLPGVALRRLASRCIALLYHGN